MKHLLFFLLFFAVPAVAQQTFTVFFDFNIDVPNQKSRINLENWMTQHPTATILTLSGFADSVDVNSYNRDLSMRRAQSVLKILEDRGMAVSGSVKLDALGEEFNKSVNQDENRRVELVYEEHKKPKSPPKEIDDTRSEEELARYFEGFTTKVKSQFGTAKKGDLIRIDNINFYLNSEIVIPESGPVMQDLYQTMADNPGLCIEIHGHICCNPNINDTKLSFRRAKYIFTYLLKKGIGLNRLGYKGFGSSRPIYDIPERTKPEQQANRRVEILIVRTQIKK